ncbi:MAG TPA: hypothetical protein GXX75_25835 [Clostridiales bacterium]|nr:hypothetical protein [Clostridiales bacterium]
MINLILWSVFYVAFAFAAQAVVHELGHYIFGRITGYRFLLFRVFGLALVREGSSYRIRYHRSPGSLGQCLMLPPEKEKYPYALVTLGGVILNMATGVAALVYLWVSRGQVPFVHAMGIVLFAFYGAGFAALNILPGKGGATVTDGTVLSEMKKDGLARSCNQAQLQMTRDLIAGKTYGELDMGELTIPEDADFTNSLVGYHKILECYRYMDKREWAKACECLDQFYPVMDRVPVMIRNMILSEQFFISILRNDTTVKDSGILMELHKCLKAAGDFNSIRIRSAYDIFSNRADKETVLLKLEKNKKNYIYKGEAIFCESLIREIRET